VARVVEQADPPIAAQRKAEVDDRAQHPVAVGVELERDLKVELLERGGDSAGVIGWIVERANARTVGAVTDHQRDPALVAHLLDLAVPARDGSLRAGAGWPE
jgi:hypothetical protein